MKESGYKGVSWSCKDQVWYAQLYHKGKKHHIGSFDDERKAALAYDKKAITLGLPTNILKPLIKRVA